MHAAHVLEGRSFPLGATVRDGGVNFALASDHAHRVELCLFDAAGGEYKRLFLPAHTNGVFHGFIPGLTAGALYGYRVHGEYAPHQGHHFDPSRLLLDPYAREIVGKFDHQVQHVDHSNTALKARVPDNSPRTELGEVYVAPSETVFYELHVKGFSRLNAAIPNQLRGTYAGLAHAASIDHLKRLGVTSVCLLPVHYHIDEAAVARRGLSNYWGYNTIGFFCPSARLASVTDPAEITQEFRAMVKALHSAGFEVILDVVFNHTAEGDEHGPAISFRGIDNAMYYRLQKNDLARSENLTGCGNTLNIAHPRVAQLVLDSLRYWVRDMGVDGFRFDLATVLGRTANGYDPHAAFFQSLMQDPILARAKLIAEPWDIGPGGYQLGQFPGRFQEWNDKFRDTTRRFWLHGGVGRGEFARRFMASSDLFHREHRKPSASVNYLCAHDGYTLADMLSYARKHNLENGESNRDGRNGEISANHGVEGPGASATVTEARKHAARTLLASLMLSQGTPMLRAGDELGQSQRGNNNAYCQDNEISWIDWDQTDQDLINYTARLIALRKEFAALRHSEWFTGRAGLGHGPDLQWFAPSGEPMSIAAWQDLAEQALAVLIEIPGPHTGKFWVGLNGDAQTTAFNLPAGKWSLELDSAKWQASPSELQTHIELAPRSIALLRHLTSESH